MERGTHIGGGALLTAESVTFANVSDRAAEPSGVMAYVARQFDPALSWDDVGWMVDAWDGPFVMKGILSVADARRAASLGVAGMVVSNHGGRQLDHTPAPISVLADIVDAVGAEVKVLVDSGFRRGSDIVKALSLGARAVMIGRPYCYGLGVAGQAGVEHAIALLGAELRPSSSCSGWPRCRASTEHRPDYGQRLGPAVGTVLGQLHPGVDRRCQTQSLGQYRGRQQPCRRHQIRLVEAHRYPGQVMGCLLVGCPLDFVDLRPLQSHCPKSEGI
jgi:FMN-dependent dehydrogenase